MTINHDQIFKLLVELFFREFMELFCPAEAALIDFRKVDFLREEVFSDISGGDRHLLDLVVKVGLLQGGEKFILIHVEFESSRKDRDFPQRMFRYFCQLFLRYETEIVPVAIFTDNAHWRRPVPDYFSLALGEAEVVRFNYRLVKLKHLDYQQFLHSGNPLAYALMAKMDYNKEEVVRLKADFLRLITGSGVDPARESLLFEFVETYMPLNPHQQTEFEQLVIANQEFEMVERFVTTYEKKGMKKGRAAGRVEQQQRMLLLLLEKRFGSLDDAVRERIQQLDSLKQLEKLFAKALDAKSLDEMKL